MMHRQGIIEARESRGYSIDGLAEKTGIGATRIHAIESGDDNPTTEEIRLMARAYGISYSQLLCL